jgi:hypothetical protein
VSAARWWRLGVLMEREGAPWTATFHVRARTEEGARRIVAERVSGGRYAVYACFASDPVPKMPSHDEIAAVFGPYRRDWADPSVAALAATLGRGAEADQAAGAPPPAAAGGSRDRELRSD